MMGMSTRTSRWGESEVKGYAFSKILSFIIIKNMREKSSFFLSRRPPSAVTETRPDRPPRRPSARVPGIKTTRPLFIPLNESTIFRSRKNRQFTRSSPHDDDVFGRRRPKFKFLEQEPAFARQRQLVSGLNEESRPNRLNGKLSVANLLNTEDLRKDDSVGQQLIVNLPTRPFPNNPFSLIDIRQPTILPLPKPPESTNWNSCGSFRPKIISTEDRVVFNCTYRKNKDTSNYLQPSRISVMNEAEKENPGFNLKNGLVYIFLFYLCLLTRTNRRNFLNISVSLDEKLQNTIYSLKTNKICLNDEWLDISNITSQTNEHSSNTA